MVNTEDWGPLKDLLSATVEAAVGPLRSEVGRLREDVARLVEKLDENYTKREIDRMAEQAKEEHASLRKDLDALKETVGAYWLNLVFKLGGAAGALAAIVELVRMLHS